METIKVNQLADTALQQLNREVAEAMDGDCVFINSGMHSPLDEEFRVVIEQIKDESKNNHLIVILETHGGSMETVERLVAIMRAHYQRVSFVIPNFAYSAGTVLALSGDRIYMDYYSVLGPIDPQYRAGDGNFLPGYGYLAKFQEVTRLINESESLDTCRAELTYLVERFDPALLFQIEQGLEHGISLISEWLPKYKFKDWKITATNNNIVTPAIKKNRAKDIAAILGDASRWHSHGRGITMKDLSGSDIKLLIDDFGANAELSFIIRNYHGLAVDYFSNEMGVTGYIHSQLGVRSVS